MTSPPTIQITTPQQSYDKTVENEYVPAGHYTAVDVAVVDVATADVAAVDVADVDATVGEEWTTPPTPKPVMQYTYDEADVMLTNIVLRLSNDKNELMIDREIEKYCELLTEFLRSQPSLDGASVFVLNVTVWHQAAVVADQDKKKELGQGNPRPTASSTSTSKSRGKARKMRALVEESAMERRMDVTTIIKTANSVLPPDVADVLLLHIIEENKSALIDLFHAQAFFYSYFNGISDVSGRIILEVTNPPSPAPTTQTQMLVTTQEGETDVDEGISFLVMVGAFIGMLWCFLTLCSNCYLLKARNEMKNKKLLRTGSSAKYQAGEYEETTYDSGDTKLVDFSSYTSQDHAPRFFDEEKYGCDDVHPVQQPSTIFADLFLGDNSEEKKESGNIAQERASCRRKRSTSTNRQKRSITRRTEDEDPPEAEENQTDTNRQDNLQAYTPSGQRKSSFAGLFHLSGEDAETYQEAKTKESAQEHDCSTQRRTTNHESHKLKPGWEAEKNAFDDHLQLQQKERSERRLSDGSTSVNISTSKPRKNRKQRDESVTKSATSDSSKKLSKSTSKTRRDKEDGEEELGMRLVQSLVMPKVSLWSDVSVQEDMASRSEHSSRRLPDGGEMVNASISKSQKNKNSATFRNLMETVSEHEVNESDEGARTNASIPKNRKIKDSATPRNLTKSIAEEVESESRRGTLTNASTETFSSLMEAVAESEGGEVINASMHKPRKKKNSTVNNLSKSASCPRKKKNSTVDNLSKSTSFGSAGKGGSKHGDSSAKKSRDSTWVDRNSREAEEDMGVDMLQSLVTPSNLGDSQRSNRRSLNAGTEINASMSKPRRNKKLREKRPRTKDKSIRGKIDNDYVSEQSDKQSLESNMVEMLFV